MARLKVDLKTLASRERELRQQLKQVRVQARVIERAERQARTERVAVLAEKFGILHITDTVLAATFKKLAAENPPSTESAKDTDTVEDAAEETRTRPPETAPGPADETAQAGGASSESRKRWPFGS